MIDEKREDNHSSIVNFGEIIEDKNDSKHKFFYKRSEKQISLKKIKFHFKISAKIVELHIIP